MNTIVLFEPLCRGFEHAGVNAGLLQTVLLAYPNAAVTYAGESSHLANVRELLEDRFAADTGRVRWQSIKLAPKYQTMIGGLREEWACVARIFSLAKSMNAGLIIFCSIHSKNLFAIKNLMHIRRITCPVLAIPHQILSSLDKTTPASSSECGRLMRLVFKLPHPRSLTYAALGDPILKCLAEVEPGIAAHFRTLELAYYWEKDRPLDPAESTCPLRFGFFGVSDKGLGNFCALASEVKRKGYNARFVMVGFINQASGEQLQNAGIEGVGNTPLSAEEFARRAESLTYAVWTVNDPSRYRLTASATFLDALSYVKPGIYLKNPFVEHFFERFGDIGYLCENSKEMSEVICSIAREFPHERYQKQCENILKGRSLFEPGSLAPKLVRIVEECKTR